VGTIVLREVSKDFSLSNATRLKVLDRISCEIAGGSFTSILGPSGCGKSTILSLIAGLDEPTSGAVSRGPDPTRVGFIFQQPRLLNWRTIAGNVALPLESSDVSRAERRERVRHFLHLVGLSGYEEYYPMQLSGGMQQRAAIARALAVEPEVLLMDEPFSGLDEWTARKLREELIRIWQETGKTIVFVTHSIGEAVFLAQHLLILSPKPATILKSIPVDLAYPRHYGDARIFELECAVVRDCLGSWGP